MRFVQQVKKMGYQYVEMGHVQNRMIFHDLFIIQPS